MNVSFADRLLFDFEAIKDLALECSAQTFLSGDPASASGLLELSDGLDAQQISKLQ